MPDRDSSTSNDQRLIDTTMIDQLRDILGPAQLEKLQTSFLNGLNEGEHELEAAVAAGDLKRIKKSAHGMAGLTAQYGAVGVSRLARAIEVDAASLDDVLPLLRDIKTTAAATRAAFAAMRPPIP